MLKKLIILVVLFLVNIPALAQIVDNVWAKAFNWPSFGDDGASSLVVDNSGNVFVTGSSY